LKKIGKTLEEYSENAPGNLKQLALFYMAVVYYNEGKSDPASSILTQLKDNVDEMESKLDDMKSKLGDVQLTAEISTAMQQMGKAKFKTMYKKVSQPFFLIYHLSDQVKFFSLL